MTNEIFDHNQRRQIIEGLCLTQSCQISTIINELLQGFNDYASKNPHRDYLIDKEYFLETLKDFINELRNSHYYSNNNLSDIFDLSPEEFEIETDKVSDEEKKIHYKLYGKFWSFNNIFSLIQRGELHDDKACGLIEIDQLENISRQYLKTSWMKSKTLEWCLINAMVYYETVYFARTINEYKPKGVWKMWRYSIWQIARFLFIEIFALILTAIISNIIDSSQGTPFWIVFATITIIRWLNPFKLEREKIKFKQQFLLAEMLSFHDTKLKHSEFNHKLLKELLYDLERKGASYSHWVYHILDSTLVE